MERAWSTAQLGAPDAAGMGGLTSAQAAARRARYGANDIVETHTATWTDVARDTLRDPMLWFLLVTALLFAWLGDYTEAAVLASALVPIAGMDAWLHRRMRASTEGLASRLASHARVIRDGDVVQVPAAELVPGDLVLVAESEAFPADGLIVAGTGLQVDESALTGESLPVRKQPYTDALPPGGELRVSETHCAAAGTRLLTGTARVRIGATGAATLYGQIVRSSRQSRHERTPLQQAIARLVAILIVVAIILCIALAVTRYAQGHGALDAFLSAVTLAVAALPEEFPIVFAFFLGIGVYRLAQRQALVRRAVVVENIGRITCICTDKTGTLTEGRLRLAHALPVEGVGMAQLLHAAAHASRRESGDPLDTALLDAATDLPPLDRLAIFPFTEDRRRETAIVLDGGTRRAYTKGAPEALLALAHLDAAAHEAWRHATAGLAGAGHKVIACAERDIMGEAPADEPAEGLRFLGLLAFEDPLREGVAEAIAQARDAGIRVIMVTGDHAATARAIATELGIGGGSPRVIEGSALAARLAGTGDGLEDVDVIARAAPAQKLDLVRALQRHGEIVAVTGDGVNDAPALQGADVGIAMGERGTRTAREIAAIVLLDDNFRTIVRAIAEGRQLFRNLQLSFAYLLMMHLPLVLTAALVPFAGFPLLYLPVHIVWLELLMHPTALLVFQSLPAARRLQPVSRARGPLQLYDRRQWLLIGLVGGAITLALLHAYLYSLGIDDDVAHARTMALVALIAAGIALVAGLTGLRTRAAATATLITAITTIALIQTPAVAALLHLRALHADEWLLAGASGALAGALSVLLPRHRAAEPFGHPSTR